MQTAGLTGSPLSYQQARLWSLQEKDNSCRLLCTLLIRGPLDSGRLESALQRVVARHEVLRTVFCFLPGLDVPVQTVSNSATWSYAVVSLEGLDEVHQLLKKEEICTSLWRERVPQVQGTLFCACLLRLATDRHLLLLRLPALCADHPTLKLLSYELLHTYISQDEDENSEEPLQYADVSAWQDELVRDDSEETEAQSAFWRKIDLSRLATQRIPFQQEERQSGQRTLRESGSWMEPHVQAVPLDVETTTQLMEHVQHRGCSPSAWLLACWSALLWRLSEESSVLIGVACDGRNYEGLENALGLYMRSVPVSLSFGRNWRFEQIVSLIDKKLHEATQRQSYFHWDEKDEQIVSNQPPFFPLSFAYDCEPSSWRMETLSFHWQQCLGESEPFILKLSAIQEGSELRLDLLADPRYLSQASLHSCAQTLQAIVQNTLREPGQLIHELPLLLPEQRQQVLYEAEGKQGVLPACVLHQLFEEQVQRRPEQTAVYSENERLSYRELNARANRLARVLRRAGVGPGELVGWCARRGVEVLVGLLGILKAGGGYVPLDSESPPERIVAQLQDAQVALVLTQKELRERLSVWDGRILSLEELEAAMREEEETNLPLLSRPDDVMYVIYTSGSTGRPRGVFIRQRSMVNYVYGLKEELGIEAGWHFATVSTLAADLGNTAIFGSLAWGGSLQIVEYATLISQATLARWWSQHPVEVLKIVPSHLSALLATEDEQAQIFLPGRALILGGEALPVQLLRRVKELGGECEVYNHYGPTETTVGILLRCVHKEEIEQGETVMLGGPLLNSRGYVLDRYGELVPEGIMGELYVGGVGEALGYVGLAAQTAEKFVPDGYSGREGARLYRTGDMVIRGSRGRLYFVGRRDSQVKIRGYRVELGEIEGLLKEHAQVRDAVVLSRGEEGRLVGYVVRRQKVGVEELKTWLSKKMPSYMIPEQWMWMEALPLSKNGKVEREKLPAPDQKEEQVERGVAGSPIEDVVRELWQEVLGKKDIGRGENFFSLGGHSLFATQVIARVRKVLQVEISVLALFESPTIMGLAQQVEHVLRGEQGIAYPTLVPVEGAREHIPLSFAQRRLWFLDQLEGGRSAYIIFRAHRLHGLLDTTALQRGLQEMIRRHEILRTTFHRQEGQPVQVVHPAGTFSLPVVDLSGLPQEERLDLALLLAGQEEKQPFNLERGPLLRVFLLHLDIQEHILLLAMHHIITDGWSNEVFIRELVAFYGSFVAGKTLLLPPLPIQYADYAIWQHQWLQGEALEKLLTYWKRCMEDAPPLLELPTDRPRPFTPTYRGTHYTFEFPLAWMDTLRALNMKEGVTLFMTLLAAFQILLSYYSGQEDIVVGTPVANRRHSELENLIGFFINTLVLRTDLTGNPSFRAVLQRVRTVCIGAYAYEDLPFEALVEVLQPERQQGRSPFFQVMFMLQNTPVVGAAIEGLTVHSITGESNTSKFDLTLGIVEAEKSLLMDIEYNVDLFDQSTIKRMAHCYLYLLETLVMEPDIQLMHVFSLLDDKEMTTVNKETLEEVGEKNR